jgi:ankyrin repeat protein
MRRCLVIATCALLINLRSDLTVGENPLVAAYHNIDIVKLLLESRAEPKTALNLIFSEKRQDQRTFGLGPPSVQVVQLLIDHRSNVMSTMDNKSLVFDAKRDSADEVIALLASTCLPLAAEAGDLARVQEFLSVSPKPNLERGLDNGATALILAARSGHIAIAELLIENKANPNAVCTDGETALFYAASNDVDIYQLLLKHKADILLGRSPPVSTRNATVCQSYR